MRPETYLADEHEIDPALIDADALTVLTKLHEAGYIAYLVGGGVRDLLVKKRPKDFDISTSALPEEVKKVFPRNCLLIGRRFRLAHIRFGNKVIEVSTFRSGESGDELIVRDNQWGSPEEDAERRDFTINGLFLDPKKHQVIDYVGGWKDIHQGLLRTIGDPRVRFKQDPVRMLRLIKFRARFGFEIDPDTRAALLACRQEIIKSSPARILEELFRMLESGASERFFHQMLELGLLEMLLPWLGRFLQSKAGHDVYNLLKCVDEYNLEAEKPANRAVLAACLLFPILDREIHIQFLDKGTTPHIGDILTITQALMRGVAATSFSHFPKRIRMEVSFILQTQYRLIPFSAKGPLRTRIARHPDFRLALSFLRLRSLQNPALAPHFEDWYKIYEHAREHMPKEERDEEEQRAPKRRRRGRSSGPSRRESHHTPGS